MNNFNVIVKKHYDWGAWGTPIYLFKQLDDEFHFTLDFCALPHNAKCKRYYSPEEDAFKQHPVNERIFCNPPYGRKDLNRFIRKLYELSKDNEVIVALIPSRTDTAYWHDCIEGKAIVRFIRGRIKFDGYNDKGESISGTSSTFPSCIVIWRKQNE